MKHFFIVGDVHGCFNTLQTLLKNWKPKAQQLIFVGDLIDNGLFSPQVVGHVRELQKEYPKTLVVRGNHEQLFMQHCLEEFNKDWYGRSGEITFYQYLQAGREINADAEWFAKLPLYFETPDFIVSHAGISDTKNPFDANNPEGVVWQRNETKKLKQLQIFGHTPKESALYDINVHAVNIDTGAYKGNKLSALVVDSEANIEEIFSVNTDERDYD